MKPCLAVRTWKDTSRARTPGLLSVLTCLTHMPPPQASLERKLLDLLADVYQDWYLRGVNVGLDGETLTQAAAFPAGSDASGPGSRLAFLIKMLFLHYGREPVVLIDEYDAPMVRLIGSTIDKEPLLEVMRSFFGVLKSSEDHLHKVFLTGISRFAHGNLFSALNNLMDLSWDPVYAAICGFTEEEIAEGMKPYLAVGAENLAAAGLEMTPDALMHALRDHYSCYRFSTWSPAPRVYNPYSLVRCLHSLQHPARVWGIAREGFAHYWMSSGSSKMPVDLARKKPHAIPLDIPKVAADDSLTYDLDNLSYSALMLQTGYYTLNPDTETGMDYPNVEVRDTFVRQLVNSHIQYRGKDPVQAMCHSLQDEKYTDFCDALMDFLADFPGEKMTNETNYHVMLHTLLRRAGVQAVSERHVLGGRPDITLEFKTHACVMEIKYNESTEVAMHQIQQNDYSRYWKDRFPYVRGLGLNVTTEGTLHIEHKVETLYGPPHP